MSASAARAPWTRAAETELVEPPLIKRAGPREGPADRKQALLNHPDKNMGSLASKEETQRVLAARAHLKTVILGS